MGIHFTRSPKIKNNTNQNSDVHFDAATSRGKDTYYGYIEEIWELYYGHDFKVPLFRCKRANLPGGGVQVDPQYGDDNSGSEQSWVHRQTILPS